MIIFIPKFSNYDERVETGPIVFNNSTSGIFIRGDNYAWVLYTLNMLKDNLPQHDRNYIDIILKKLNNEDYFIRVYDKSDNVTCKVSDGITYISGTTEPISTGGIQFGDDWDGYFIEKEDSTQILDLLRKIDVPDNIGLQIYLNYSINIFEDITELKD